MADETISTEKVVVRKVSSSREQLLDCGSSEWASIPGQRIELGATPLANQPSPYIKATFDEKKIGAVKEVSVKAVHNATDIFLHFEWRSDQPNDEIGDIGIFPDGVSVLLPFKDPQKTPIKEMGSKDFPTNSWYWRPDFKGKPKNQVAHGLSTSLYTKTSSLVSRSEWKDGMWCVVMTRPLAVPEEAVNLHPGIQNMTIGIACWEGANGERGGVKAFSKEWRPLEVEA